MRIYITHSGAWVFWAGGLVKDLWTFGAVDAVYWNIQQRYLTGGFSA